MVDLIVFSSIVFVAVFFVAWIVRPDLRAWIEKPKYRFQANLRGFDQAQWDQAQSDKAQRTAEVSGRKGRR
jgi:hypothetical protein